MNIYIEKKQFSELYSVINSIFLNVKGNHISQFIKITAKENKVFFEYFNEKDYLKVYYEVEVIEEGSAVINFDVLKVINSLNGKITIKQDNESKNLYFLDDKKALNVPQSEIAFELQHPFGNQSSVEILADELSEKIKFIKNITKEADIKQDRFKNILINNENNIQALIGATGHLLVVLKLNTLKINGSKFYIPRSLLGSISSIKKVIKKDSIIKISNFESYHSQIEIDNILLHSSYETKEFVDFSIWNNVSVESAIQINKEDLLECLNSLLLLKPYLDKVDFSIKDNHLRFYSAKNNEIDMRALIDINKGKNIDLYKGSFSGKEIKNFISRLNKDENVILGLDKSLQTNIVKTSDSKLICNTLTTKGV